MQENCSTILCFLGKQEWGTLATKSFTLVSHVLLLLPKFCDTFCTSWCHCLVYILLNCGTCWVSSEASLKESILRFFNCFNFLASSSWFSCLSTSDVLRYWPSTLRILTPVFWVINYLLYIVNYLQHLLFFFFMIS